MAFLQLMVKMADAPRWPTDICFLCNHFNFFYDLPSITDPRSKCPTNRAVRRSLSSAPIAPICVARAQFERDSRSIGRFAAPDGFFVKIWRTRHVNGGGTGRVKVSGIY